MELIAQMITSNFIRFYNCTFQNNKLIFSTTGSKSKILNTIQRTANAMIFGAHMPYRSIQLQTPETNKHNILNHLMKEEDDAKKKMQEEDEMLYIRQSKPPSALELSPLEFSDSTVHDNVSDKTYQETYQSKVSVADGWSRIKQTVTKDHIILVESEFVNIENAFRRISSQAVTSCNDLPRFQVANKKGYALGVTKEVNEKEMKTNESNESSPIVFGNGTSVLAKKRKRHLDDAATSVISKKYKVSSNDKTRKLIVDKYTRLSSREVMLLKTSSCENIKVFKKLSVGVMDIGEKLNFKQFFKHSFDCNRLTLISLLKENNFDLDILDLGTIDDPKNIVLNIATALEDIDLLVTTGHFSDKDYVKNTLKNCFNATFLFENVDMKPGKLTAFASCYYKDKPKIILCLPGNTTSVFVTAHIFLLPLVKWIHFDFKENWSTINVKVDQTLILHSRPRYVWAKLSLQCYPKVTCNEEYSIDYFLSNSKGNALLILPPKTLEKSTLEISSQVPALLVKFPF